MSSSPSIISREHSKDKVEALHIEDAPCDIDEETPLTWRTWLAILVANLATFSQLLAIVGPAGIISFLVQSLGGANEALWIVAAPTLCQAAGAPLLARLSDIYGRKIVAIIPQCFGIVGAIVASRANDMSTLLAGTCVMGISVTIVAINSTIPSEVLPRKYRTIGQATIQLAASAGTLSASLIGGAFVEKDPENGWRNMYYLLIALYSASTLGFIIGYNPPPLPSQHKRTGRQLCHDLDVIGVDLFATGFTLLLIGLNWGGAAYTWDSPHVVACLVVGLICILAMIIWEMFGRTDGILDHRLFHVGRNLWLAMFGLFVDGWLYFGGFSGDQSAGMGHHSNGYRAAKLTKDVRTPLAVGFGLFAVGVGLFTIADGGSSDLSIGISAIAGFGFSAPLVLLVMIAQLGAPVDLIASVTAVVVSIRGLGGSIGTVLMGVAYKQHSASCLAAGEVTTLQCEIHGYRWAWISLLPLAVLAVLAALALSDVSETMTSKIDHPIERSVHAHNARSAGAV